jgi:hypothetical protein
LKSYRSVDVKNGLAWAIWTSTAQVMAKKRSGIKLAIWLPTTKSRESTRPQFVQVVCNTPLESSWQELQVCFIPHPNQRSEKRVITPRIGGSPNWDSFGTPPWESRHKKPFRCRCHGEVQRILYGGRCLPSSPSRDDSCESRIARGLS